MCGIAGIYEFKKTNVNQADYINWSLTTMKHRGPDSNGFWTNQKNYHTGFVRLAIRDLSATGNQPMHSHCGRYVLVFNGEIYNTQDYKQILLDDGITFNSTTDTEILLYALIKWKAEVLKSLNGIFAFGFYDKEKDELLLARDRLGIKPLYIGYSNYGLIYSSQYDHIINHNFCKDNSIDNQALNLYLSLGYVPEGEGIISNTFLLPHGHYVIVNNEGWNLHQYYEYPIEQQTSSKSLEEVLRHSTQQQLVSDVPVGTFMSGGIDSTLVAYFATQQQPIQSFTIGVNDKHLDETADAAAFIQYFRNEHSIKRLTENDLLSMIDSNTKAYSEPFADFSSIPTLAVSQFARQTVTVALSGDGGDELFWGYPRSKNTLQNNLLVSKPAYNKYLQLGMQKILNKKKLVNRRHLQTNSIINYYYRSMFIAGADNFANTLLAEPQTCIPYFLEKTLQKDINFDSSTDVMNAIRKLEMDIHLQRILIKVDRASMYHSLEVRVPLLDNNVLDYSSSVNFESCMKNGYGKTNLRELLASKTNKELVDKPKKGFDVPMRSWLNGQLKKDVADKLMNMPLHLAVHFNRPGIEKMLKQHENNLQDMTWLIWSLYTLVNWDAYHRNSFKNSVLN